MLLDVDMCLNNIDTWQIVGNIITIIKITIPIILIVTSTISLFSLVTAKNPTNVTTYVSTFIKKLIAAILIFLAPNIIGNVINMLIENNYENKYYKCETCLFYPNSNECHQYLLEKPKKEYIEGEDIDVEGSLDTNKLHDLNGSISADYAAIGINGGVRIKIKNKDGIRKYKIKAKDYKGKIYEPYIPDNNTGDFAHDYHKYTTQVLDDTYMDILKMDHRYVKINTWLNKNNEEYKFKIYGYKDNGNKASFESEWLSAIPYNVEVDAPMAEVNLPSLSTMHDPEGGREGTNLNIKDNKKISYENRLYVTSISESTNSVVITWENTIKDMEVSSYIIRYKEYYSDNEKQNRKIDYTIERTTSTDKKIILNNLSTEQEYLVQIVANGRLKSNNKAVSTMVEEIVIPHDKSSRKALLKNVKRGNPYHGTYTLNGYCTKAEAEAYANYGNKGKAFESKTTYFLWFNMYQFRGYIFSKNESEEWRLLQDFAIRIGNSSKGTTPSGQYNIKGREWTDNGENSYALRYLINYQDLTFGNVLHSDGVGSIMPRVVETGNRFTTAGCTIIDMPWLKFIYEHCIGSWLYNDYGS